MDGVLEQTEEDEQGKTLILRDPEAGLILILDV
jgi:hypothetical protein